METRKYVAAERCRNKGDMQSQVNVANDYCKEHGYKWY